MIGKKKRRVSVLIALVAVLFIVACGPAPTASPAPTTIAPPTSTATAIPTPTQTLTPTPTPEPAWYQTLDPSYAILKYRYALVTNPKAKVYTSLQDAIGKSFNFAYLPKQPAYVAFYTTETKDGHTFYGLTSGNWMVAEDLQEVTPSRFTGILLTREVDFRFGWVLAETHSVNRTGAPVRTFARYQIVHEIPVEEQKPGTLAIGVDEWLPETSLALVRPEVPKEAGPDTCRFISVSLAEQTLSVYDGCKLVFATLISSGQDPRWTYSGQFAILSKFDFVPLLPPPESISEYYLEEVPYFMTYAGDWGFHGAYWHDQFGAPVSHGCINLSPADAHWLYDWANIGERVIILP